MRRCVAIILLKQESHAVAGKQRDAAVNSDRYQVCWHFAGAISAGVLGQFSAQHKSDLHVLLRTYLFTCLLAAHYTVSQKNAPTLKRYSSEL